MSGGQIGSIGNDVMQIVTNGFQIAKNQKDQSDIDQAYNGAGYGLAAMPQIDAQKLKVIAQQMGVPPDVLMSSYRNQQIDALRQMQNIASRGGLDDSAIAANQQSGMQAARQNQAGQQAISNSLARRGLSAGSGAQLAARGASNQSAYNTNAMVNGQNAADAQMRALSAINASGRLAGDISSADQARMQSNRDAKMGIDRFNTGVRNTVNANNAGANLDAFNANLGLRKDKLTGAMNKGGANSNLRTEQTGYHRDSGNRWQNISSQADFMGGE